MEQAEKERLAKVGKTFNAKKIATNVKGANRVVWDVTPKPPATIEWE